MPETILVADDDEDVRATICQALAVLGYRSREAADGRSALQSIQEERPDVVILDYIMPGLDGAEVAAELKINYPGLPVIFASAHVDQLRLRLAPGDTPILGKPFLIGELAQLIDEALQDD